eukprot:TRINITY_DN5539_c0_g1_i1.p1 TRINITY_DN5539_c0_g1~~TRINITY_DN5539_c0_g1_i1.p1  ORF type:complete len:329 (+),score=92.77 TRINITY_DN5539_c0_g1_i1:105-989(+)
MSQEQRPRVLFGAAAALYAFSLLEVSPAFVAPSAAGADVARATSLRGAAAQLPAADATPLFSRASCQVASTFLTLSACALASRTTDKKSKRTSRTKVCSEGGAAVVCFSDALADAGVKKEEAAAVTQDVMKVKELLDEEKFRDELRLFINQPFLPELEKAAGILKLFGKLQSTVFPKYVTFLAKRKRLPMLREVLDFYMKKQYITQKIEPVRVKCAQRITDEQAEKLKAKMKVKTGAENIKLIVEISTELVAGFVVEWGFTDPDTLTCPTEGLDLSLRNVVKRAAVREGVPVGV